MGSRFKAPYRASVPPVAVTRLVFAKPGPPTAFLGDRSNKLLIVLHSGSNVRKHDARILDKDIQLGIRSSQMLRSRLNALETGDIKFDPSHSWIVPLRVGEGSDRM